MLGTGGPSIKVCCGPRCGILPEHCAIYAAAEAARPDVPILPTMCRGLCGNGVTVVREDGTATKAHDVEEMRARLTKGE